MLLFPKLFSGALKLYNIDEKEFPKILSSPCWLIDPFRIGWEGGGKAFSQLDNAFRFCFSTNSPRSTRCQPFYKNVYYSHYYCLFLMFSDSSLFCQISDFSVRPTRGPTHQHRHNTVRKKNINFVYFVVGRGPIGQSIKIRH